MSGPLAGRRALITGAARGIGAGIAQGFAGAGAALVLADRDAEGVAAQAASLGAQGIACDVASEASVRALFARCGPIDILVHAAGVTRAETVFEATLASFEEVLRINLSGAFLCSQAAMEGFRARATGGRILLIGSVVAHQGALRGHVAYAASKGGLHAFARTLARTAAPMGVTVNVVAPGLVETEMLLSAHGPEGIARLAATTPTGRLQSVQEIAAACLYLASEAGGAVTGATLDVNGGLVMR